MRNVLLSVLVAFLVCFGGLARADYLEVRRDAWLKQKAEPHGAQVRKLELGALLELANEAETNGYYAVRTSDGTTGFVYRTLVRRHPGEMPPTPAPSAGGPASTTTPSTPAGTCGGAPLTVHFYDAGQALSALVTLPDGRHILVDAGESPSRPCAGCKAWHQRVMTGLREDLQTGGLDALWATHQHSDHIGGAQDVLATFPTKIYIDNGLDLSKPTIQGARGAAQSSGATIRVVDPGHPQSPIAGTAAVKFVPIVPAVWPPACPSDPNACSIALRIDYCKSSVLFEGDASSDEEAGLDPRGDVTLLQVGHHGSDTSTGAKLLSRAHPKYAVISSALPNEGTNDGYCHPRSITVEHLTAAMGGAGNKTIKAFDGKASCTKKNPQPDHWIDVPAADHIWATARDGDVVLVTKGDGVFERIGEE